MVSHLHCYISTGSNIWKKFNKWFSTRVIFLSIWHIINPILAINFLFFLQNLLNNIKIIGITNDGVFTYFTPERIWQRMNHFFDKIFFYYFLLLNFIYLDILLTRQIFTWTLYFCQNINLKFNFIDRHGYIWYLLIRT